MAAPDPDAGAPPRPTDAPMTPTDATTAPPPSDATMTPIIDWSRTARRLRAVLLTIGTAALLTWLVVGLFGDGFEPRLLAELLGLGLLLSFAVEVVVVGGVAVRGMLAAGARGDRLSSEDVYLLPPQLLRRRSGGGRSDGAGR